MKKYSSFPALSRVLSTTLDEPLFQDADVQGEFWALNDRSGGVQFLCEPSSLKLILPPVTKEDSETIPKVCLVKVKHPFEDAQARATNFYLTFDVQIQGYEQTPDGMYKPQYTANLEDYQYES
jgi:hypothetical protein